MKTQLLVLVALCGSLLHPLSGAPANPYDKWKMGPPHDERFFPIAVWLQNPQKARQYRDAGFNTYVGLWNGPTEGQLAALKTNGMKVICHQNAVARQHLDDPTIIGWMHGDEPDNAQSLGHGKGYGPPILPSRIVADCNKLREADPSRPVMLNLGQGVAWDRWHGRGVRSNHPEDYPEYIKGCDIASFDIYPVAHPHPDVSGNLWYVAKGVERLVKWSAGQRVVWNCIECTRIQTDNQKATPQQVRAEVWMSLIHGSMGLIYFVHEWKPKFNESALLSDPEMLAGVTAINRQIQQLAPVLNSPPSRAGLTTISTSTNVPIAAMRKSYMGNQYIFAVGMRNGSTTATFTAKGLGTRTVQVLDEKRTIKSQDDVFQDEFKPWEVHLYMIREVL